MKVTKIFKRIKCEIMYRQATAKADYASRRTMVKSSTSFLRRRATSLL